MKRVILVSLAILGLSNLAQIHAQSIVYDQQDIIEMRSLECMDEYLNVFPSIRCAANIEGAFNILPVYMNTVYNTRYAKGINDGPAWQGRGLNTTFGFGLSGKIGRLTYVINPMVQYAENRPYYTGSDLTNSPKYQYPYFQNRIDFVMRYGNDPYVKIFPGQSEVSLNLDPVEIALSTQNMIWGPGIYNPIMMSTNAAGIPHLKVGTLRPIHTAIGKWTGNMYWGLLRESEYFNTNPDDDWRYFTAINIGYRPSFWDEMTIGIHRTFYTQARYAKDFFYDGFMNFSGFFSEGDDRMVNGKLNNDYYDQNMSVTFDWRDDNSDMNIYAEWSRGDFAGGFVTLVEQYERTSTYMYGVANNFHFSSNQYIRFIYEHASLAWWHGDSFNSKGGIYKHTINPQGYTNNGQVIGAFVGPGGQADMLNVAYVTGKNVFTFEYQRARYNDDYFYTTFKTMSGPTPQDIEHQLGLRFQSELKGLSYNIGAFIAVRDNYLFDDDAVLVNYHTSVTLRYSFQ